MLGEHGLSRFSKRRTNAILVEVLLHGLTQDPGDGSALFTRVSAQGLQSLAIHLGAEFDRIAHNSSIGPWS